MIEEKNIAGNEVEVEEMALVSKEDFAPAASLEVFNSPGMQVYSSIKENASREDKIKMYNAVNACEDSIIDFCGQVLEITDMIAHPVSVTNPETGEITNGLRVVLVDGKGKPYSCVSSGVVNSLTRIISMFGSAPWTPALRIKPKQVKTTKGYKVLTLQLV